MRVDIMSYANLKQVLDDKIHLRLDKRFLETVQKWKKAYYSRNPEHVGFFTGNYFGVHIPKWTNYDNDYWFNDVCDTDEDDLTDDILALPSINKDWSVSSNTLSILFVYLMHLAENTKELDQKNRDLLKLTLMEILIARYISSAINYYFSRSPTTVEIAREVNERLSNRFTLKTTGSWAELIKHRAETMVFGENTRGIHSRQEVFISFKDEDVIRKLNITKTAVNDTIQALNKVFREVLDDKRVVASSSPMGEGAEGLYLKDLVKNTQSYLRYQDEIWNDKHAFMKFDLMEVIEGSMPTISSNLFRSTLEWMYDNRHDKKWEKKIDEFRHEITIYSLGLIEEENIKQTDLVHVAYRIRQNFSSGRANDKQLVQCRKLADSFIIAYRPKSKGKLITLERVALMMYFVLRTLGKNYYN